MALPPPFASIANPIMLPMAIPTSAKANEKEKSRGVGNSFGIVIVHHKRIGGCKFARSKSASYACNHQSLFHWLKLTP
jgi:hypothetical protein